MSTLQFPTIQLNTEPNDLIDTNYFTYENRMFLRPSVNLDKAYDDL